MTIVDDRQTRSWSISECTRYRYSLTQRWGHGERLITWVLLNPSMVEEMVDDPTTLRVGDFSRRWGYDRMEIVNLFALRAAGPEELSCCRGPRRAEEPIVRAPSGHHCRARGRGLG